MKAGKRWTAYLGVGAALAVLLTGNAGAQGTDISAGAQGTDISGMTDSSGRQLEEIQVFAQKKGRAESLQEVPGAITAFNENQLEQIVFQDLSDISYNIPNVSFEEVGTFPGVQNFTIRGQGINSSIPSVDPTVGTFIDGVYVGTTYGVVLDTWDLESVEVLRGSQGLLFGRNVTGGAVLLRTIRPDPSGEFEAKARVMATNEDRQVYSVAAGGPLIEDTLAARIMLYYENDDGYFDNNRRFQPVLGGALPIPPFTYFNQQPGGRDLNQLETKIARPSIVWSPTEELEFSLITEIGKLDGDGAAWTVVDGNTALNPLLGGQRDGNLNDFTTSIDEYGKTDINWTQVTFETEWEVAGGLLTNIAGYRKVDAKATSDIDGTGLPIFTASGDTKQDQWSNETRFATRLMDRWDMTVGVYYLTQDIKYREGRYIQVDLGSLPGIVPSPPPPFGLGTLIAVGGDMDAKTFGLFWNNDFDITDTVTLIAGLRYSYEDKDTRIITGPTGGGGGSCTDVKNYRCQFDDLGGNWDNWTPKLGVRWNFTDYAQTYAFFTQGYRTGGFNFRNAKPSVIPPGPTRQEEQDNYEVGLKADLFDDRLRINAAYFYNDIDNLQVELNTGDPDVIVLQGTVNAGDVTIKGVELEVTGLVADYLTLFGSVGYLDGSYDNKNSPWDGINPGVPGGTTPWLGNELIRLARWSYTLGGTYDIPLNSYGTLSFRTDYGYRDSNPYDAANQNYFDRQKRWSASATWLSRDDRWTVTAFGKNMTDDANYGNITSIAGLYTAGPMQKGQEYGLQVEFRL